MLCQECQKRPAAVHFVRIVQGQKTEVHICEVCARAKGEMMGHAPNGFSIHQLISGFLHPEAVFHAHAQAEAQAKTQELRCEHCGLSISQFRKMGRFGCSQCYATFSEPLDHLFKKVHGSTTHSGKIPKRAQQHIHQQNEVAQLRKQMSKLIIEEQFEQAAQLRDHIRQLEQQFAQGGDPA